LLNETADAEASYRQASRYFGELAAADPGEPIGGIRSPARDELLIQP
jgi:hypothetical protein